MASKGLLERKQSADGVVALLDERGGALASAAGDSLGEVSLLRRLVPLLGALLSRARDVMVQADQVHEHALGYDRSARNECERAAERLSELLTEVREVMELLYGGDVARRVFATSTPQDPVVLDRFATEVVQRLGRVALPLSRVAGLDLDAEATSRSVQSAHEALATKLNADPAESADAKRAWIKRHRAIERYDRIFRGVALVLTGLGTLAGDDEFGESVRPSPLHPGRTAVPKFGAGG
jgi:hypothetical protein